MTRFIRAAAGVVAATAAAPLLGACQLVGGSSQRTGSAGATVARAGQSAAWPAYIAPTGGPKPDYVSQDARVVAGFEHYPKDPFQSWTKATPGTGGDVNIFTVAYYPPPTPYEQNPTWQEVNRRLNANVQMNIVASSDYRVKIGTLMSGSQLPDLIHLYRCIAGAPNLPDFIKARCADLTPYLSGDAINDYPNLAAIPTYAWKNSLCAIDGKLYQWPIHRYLPGLSYFFKNTDIYDKEIGANYIPKDAQDLKKVMRELNRPQQNRWAIGNVARAPSSFGVAGYASMFGAPNVWGTKPDGGLVRDIETEQYKAAVGFLRDIWSEGLMWSNAPVAARSRPDFAAGRFALSQAIPRQCGREASELPVWRLHLDQRYAQGESGSHQGVAPHRRLAGGAIRQSGGPAAVLWPTGCRPHDRCQWRPEADA